MVRIRNHLTGAACACALLVVTSCGSRHVHHHRHIGHGPPAHARAHGYHRKHVHGYELVYNASYGVYVVVGVADCYYHEGHFYRLRGDVWQISLRADSGWKPVGRPLLPSGLRARTHAKAKVMTNSGNAASGKVAVKAVEPAQGKVAVKATGPAKSKVTVKATEPAKGKAKGKDKGRGFAKAKKR